MTRDELLTRLREIALDRDKEHAHAQADAALLEYLNDPEIEDALDAIDMWYA